MNMSAESGMTYHGTTILAVRHQGRTAVAGDGQVTLNASVIKHRAKKVRRIFNDKIIVGFAGATADAFTLFEHFEKKLKEQLDDLGIHYDHGIQVGGMIEVPAAANSELLNTL